MMHERKISIQLLESDDMYAYCEQVEPGADDYVINLNSNDDPDARAADFLHWCLLIYHDDFNGDRAADEVESERHNELIHLLHLLQQRQADEGYSPIGPNSNKTPCH